MSNRKELLESISNTIADYREGEVPQRTPSVVEKWVCQFPDEAQDGILAELGHLLSQTYIPRVRMTSFLRLLVTHPTFCDHDPKTFWKRSNFLNIQQGGNSQREMLAIFGELLEDEINLKLADCGSNDELFIYLDDGLFGGGRVLQDLSLWIEQKAPVGCEVRIVVAAVHSGGKSYASRRIARLINEKQIKISWWNMQEIENLRLNKNISDVLWPTEVPTGPLAEAYVRYLTEEQPKYKIELRSPGSVGKHKLFSSDAGRILLEQQFLIAGLKVRDGCPNLPVTMRPLGATLLKTFGFGATIVTFRNCPNNCPLALWAGDPWYPLFPRSTNSEAFMKRWLES